MRNINRELRAREGAIPAPARGGLSVDDFCALKEITKYCRCGCGGSARSLPRNRLMLCDVTTTFTRWACRHFDVVEINTLLGRNLPDLEALAVAQVQRHFAAIGEADERWVGDGMHRIEGEETEICPFCAQDHANSPRIETTARTSVRAKDGGAEQYC